MLSVSLRSRVVSRRGVYPYNVGPQVDVNRSFCGCEVDVEVDMTGRDSCREFGEEIKGGDGDTPVPVTV